MPTNPNSAPRSRCRSSSAGRPPRRRRRSRTPFRGTGWLALAGLALLALLLAGCGSSSPSSTSSAAKEQQAEVKNADFAKCLREHGIEATASTGPGGEGHAVKVRGGGRVKMEAAQKACKKYQPEPQKVNLSPQQKVEQAEAVEKFAKCMREHGIEVHASSSEGGISIQIHGNASGPNPESPGFQKAQSSCQKLLPFKGKGQLGTQRSDGQAPAGSESGSSAAG